MTYEITDAVTNKQITPITSFLGIGYKGESKVTRNPVEKSGFFAANKVGSPWAIPLTIAITGTPESLRSKLAALGRYEKGTDLVNITTPFHTYLNGSIETLNWTIKEEGSSGMLIIELGIVEIRQIDAQYTSVSVPPKRAAQVKNKSDASTINTGHQQPKKTYAEKGKEWLGFGK